VAIHLRKASPRPRRGAATVELALILPIFLLLCVGMIEFGRAFMVQQTLTSAAREGARFGALPGTSNNEIETRVREFLAAGGVDPTVAQVDVSPQGLETASSGEQVRVLVEVAYQDVSWLAAPWYLRDADLSNETVMRRE